MRALLPPSPDQSVSTCTDTGTGAGAGVGVSMYDMDSIQLAELSARVAASGTVSLRGVSLAHLPFGVSLMALR